MKETSFLSAVKASGSVSTRALPHPEAAPDFLGHGLVDWQMPGARNVQKRNRSMSLIACSGTHAGAVRRMVPRTATGGQVVPAFPSVWIASLWWHTSEYTDSRVLSAVNEEVAHVQKTSPLTGAGRHGSRFPPGRSRPAAGADFGIHELAPGLGPREPRSGHGFARRAGEPVRHSAHGRHAGPRARRRTDLGRRERYGPPHERTRRRRPPAVAYGARLGRPGRGARRHRGGLLRPVALGA